MGFRIREAFLELAGLKNRTQRPGRPVRVYS
jgi:hypothetical protein